MTTTIAETNVQIVTNDEANSLTIPMGPFNNSTQSEIYTEILNIDGVKSVTANFSNEYIVIAFPNCNLNLLRIKIKMAIKLLLSDENRKVRGIKFKLPKELDDYFVVETNRVNDKDLCEALRAVLGITVRLERNGYNLIFENYDSYGTSTLTKKQVAKAISGYYAGTLPRTPFELLEMKTTSNKVSLTFSRRLSRSQMDRLKSMVIAGVEIYDVTDNGHTVVARPQNSFFAKGDVAVLTYKACVDLLSD